MTTIYEKYNIGYVYLRDNPNYIQNNVIKMGVTTNIINRASTYITGEFEKGSYILVIKIYNNLRHIDNTYHLKL